MTKSLVRAALAAGLLVLPLASIALAGGGKPAPAPAKPAPAKPPSPSIATAASLEALETAADKAEADARREIRRQRYEKVVAYLKANPTAADAEQALGTAMDLAEELEEWAKTAAHADEYLAAHAEGSRKVDAIWTKAGALTRLDARKAEVKPAFDAAFKAVKVEQQNPNQVIGLYSILAGWQADTGDIEGAKGTWQALKDAFADNQYSGPVAGLAEKQMEGLPQVGKEPPPIPASAKDLDGKGVSLADYKGKVVLIDFWATWCGPCRAELPNVIAAYRKFHDKGFEVLGVSLDQPDQGAELRKFLQAQRMPWRQIYDPTGKSEVATAYGASSIPHTVLLDREGKIARIGLQGDALVRTLEHLLK